MALPSRNDLLTMDFSQDGRPFCQVAAKSGIELDGLDYSSVGSPWWGVEVGGATTHKQAVDATAVGNVAVFKEMYLSLPAVAIGVATATAARVHDVAATATAIGVAALSSATIYAKAVDAVAIGVAALNSSITYTLTTAATAVGVAAASRASTFYRTISAIAIGVGSVAKSSTFHQICAAIAAGIATVIAALPGPEDLCDLNVECSIPTKGVTAAISLKAVTCSIGSVGNGASAAIPVKAVTCSIPEKDVEVEPCLI